jgi:hypothetical protein
MAEMFSTVGTYAPVMHCDGWIDQITTERPKPRERTIFIFPRKPAVADNVSSQNRRDLASLKHPTSAAVLDGRRENAHFNCVHSGEEEQ